MMRTKTEEFGTYLGIQEIHDMESDGWAVRQIIPIMESDVIHSADAPKVATFTTKVWVVFERELESGWVQRPDPLISQPVGDETLQGSMT